jgi:hypothetical protein
VLVNGLPPEAATWRVEGRQWTNRDELLAIVAERVDAWGLINARLHVDKKHQGQLPTSPLQISRPTRTPTPEDSTAGEKPKKDRYQKSRERAAFFG